MNNLTARAVQGAPALVARERHLRGDGMKGHEAVAFERGTSGDQGQHKGYAARCETCGAVTFGGFRTKTDAKAALLHSEPA